MYGPPGCGKTHLARGHRREIQAGFIAVGINDVLDMWIGNSERNLHELFEQARRHRPASCSLTRWTRWERAAATCGIMRAGSSSTNSWPKWMA
jgi:ATP-dependent Zn protease